MEVARTSMIHAAALHFLWLFVVRYAANQLNLWPRVSLPETSPTLHWTGEVGDASVFRVWGARALVRDTSADKLSSRAIPNVFLGFPTDAPGWQFYHPTLRRVLSSQDVTFDESVPFYRLFPFCTAPLPPPRRSSSLQPVEVIGDSGAAGVGAARGAASGGAEPAGAEPGGAEPERVEPGGAEPAGAEPGGAEPAGMEPGGAELGGAELAGAESGGAESGGAEPRGAASAGGPTVALLELEALSLEALALETLELETLELEALDLEVLELEVLELEALELEALELEALELEALEMEALELEALELEALELEVLEVEVLELEVLELKALALEALELEALELEVLEMEALELEALELEALEPEALELALLALEAPELEVLSLPSSTALPPDSPLPAPPRCTKQPASLTERCEPASCPASPVRTVRRARRVPRPRPPPVPGTHSMALRPSSIPQRVPLPSPPASSLPDVPDPESDTSLGHYYVACLVAESESVCPPSVGGECALGTNVLEDRQEDFECLAAAVPHLVAMLLAPEGDPDALDIPTPRSYTEAISGPYSS
ncbi:unnamed protein product [Closterium sp. Yama58-4]|nr:unnamed protein product [Closterium sp. Yama58-4]